VESWILVSNSHEIQIHFSVSFNLKMYYKDSICERCFLKNELENNQKLKIKKIMDFLMSIFGFYFQNSLS
jgi:hypothetical protein